MRILMACAAFPPFVDGGGPISALMLARMLLDEGHEVRVINCADSNDHDTYEGIPVRRLKSLNIYWNYHNQNPAWKKLIWHGLENGNPRAFFAMQQEIRKYSPDILLTDSIENINVATWAAARSLNVPVAHTLRSAFLLCWNGVMQKDGRSCARQCASCKLTSTGKRFFSRFVDLVIGESWDIIERHTSAGYFPIASQYRIPGAIKQAPQSSPRRYPEDRPVRIGFLGAHTKFKGLDVLAEAARLLPDSLNAEFIIGGTGHGPFVEDVKKLFPKGKTSFLGWTESETFFPQIDVLAFPSIGREAFGRVTIEAYSHGIPVVGSNLGGISETIIEGRTGHLVPPSEPTALSNALCRAISDKDTYEALSAGALEAAGIYSLTQTAKAYTAALSETVERFATLTEKNSTTVSE